MVKGVSHIAVTGFDVWCLEDGTHVFEAGNFPGLGYDEQESRLEAAGETEIRTVFNAFLIKDDAGHYTLVDTGAGKAFGDKAGLLPQRLAAVGVHPDHISTLIFTHLHTDHCGGAMTDGVALFPNAKVYVHANEQAYWAKEDHLAKTVLDTYASQTVTVTDNQEIARGLIVWDLPGHTPGHMGLRIGPDLVLVADIIHSEALQMGDPQLSSEYDMDAWEAATTRLDALREIAADGVIFSGGHILGPSKFARLVAVGDGFVAVPA